MKYWTTTQTTVMTNASIANQGGGRRNGEESKNQWGENLKASNWDKNLQCNGDKIKEAIGTKIKDSMGTKSKKQWGQN